MGTRGAAPPLAHAACGRCCGRAATTWARACWSGAPPPWRRCSTRASTRCARSGRSGTAGGTCSSPSTATRTACTRRAGQPVGLLPRLPRRRPRRGRGHPLSLPAAAVLAASVFGLTATLAIWLAVRQVLGPRLADATALLFVFFPLSCILSFAYTEGLFLTRRGRVPLRPGAAPVGHGRPAGLRGRPDPQHRHRRRAVRPGGGAACGVAHQRRLRPLAAAALAPLGLAAFMAYSWAMVGTPLAFVTSEQLLAGAALRLVRHPGARRGHGPHRPRPRADPAPGNPVRAAVVFAYLGVVLLLALTRGAHGADLVVALHHGQPRLRLQRVLANSIPRYTMVAFPLLAAMAWKVRPTARRCAGRAHAVARGGAHRPLPHWVSCTRCRRPSCPEAIRSATGRPGSSTVRERYRRGQGLAVILGPRWTQGRARPWRT